MAYQFVHIETYSDAPKKVRGTKDHFNSAAQVEGEAAREERYSRHVDAPQKPLHMNFDGLLRLPQLIARRKELVSGISETLTSATGKTYSRKLRRDAATLYTEIHSHPLTSADYLTNKKAHHPTILKWAKLAVEDFQRRMPDGVEAAAVMHLDEGHVHMHILAINAADAKLDANKLHAGKVAAAAHRASNDSEALMSLPKPELQPLPLKPKKPKPSKNRDTQKKRDAAHKAALTQWSIDRMRVEARNRALLKEWEAANDAHLMAGRKMRGKPQVQLAYDDALRQLQDHYYEAVGKPCGLLRDGPRRERLSTKEYAKRKRSARKLATELDAAETLTRALQVEKTEVDHQKTQIQGHQAALDSDAATLNKLAARLKIIEADLARQSEQMAQEKAEQKAQTARQLKELSAKQADVSGKEKALAVAAERLGQREAAVSSAEAEIRTQQQDIAETTAAMESVIEALETGTADIRNGRLHIPKSPNLLQRILQPMFKPRTKMQELFQRFVSIITRTPKGFGSMGAAPNEDARSIEGP